MRIPWIGHLALFMRNSISLPVVIAFILLVVIIELVLPLFRPKPKNGNQATVGKD